MTHAATVEDRLWMPVTEVSAAGGVRRSAVALGEEVGLPAGPLANLAIVATEIATNVARHADDGRILLRLRRDADRVGIELVATDRGPGMADVVAATRDGHSTAGTLGVGLGAITRLADEFDAYSLPGSGTVLAVTLWAAGPAKPGQAHTGWATGLSRPIEGEQVCGDAYAVREVDGRRQILLCDGLGHGPLAASAAQAVINEFAAAPARGPKDVMDHIHQRTRHTRGTVAGIAELDAAGAVVRFAGIGNISAVIVAGDQRRTFVSLPGVLGQQRRESREFEYPMPDDGLVILHSDGLTDRWSLDAYPGLRDHTPLVIAATLLRDAARRRDDAAVLVARAS
jgi:anti-sigma regulatory factor (Ser/Thr protein kinase)/serine/threonine protein phosphatase PrpC